MALLVAVLPFKSRQGRDIGIWGVADLVGQVLAIAYGPVLQLFTTDQQVPPDPNDQSSTSRYK